MRHLVIGTAGHIDHGKSSLVLALTGTDPDRLQEEKARGITIDLGFAHTSQDGAALSFVDVPGHERFVRNMAAGVGGMDVVMLHVAADESVMPQTREHFEICRLLEVPAGLVVITKADLVDADTLDVVRLEVQELVAGSFLEHAPVLAVSARTGVGLAELRATLAGMAGRVRTRRVSGPPRLPIDRVFSMRGFGTIVTGTLVAGSIRAEDDLTLLPSRTRVKVRGLQVHGEACAEAQAGQRVAVNLSGVEVGDITRGETLAGAAAATVTSRADVEIELLPSARALRHGARVRLHQGTRELAARIALAGDAAAIDPGARTYARLHLDGPTSLVRGDRFILRAPAPLGTIGGGAVLDPEPPKRGVRTTAGRARFERLASTAADAVALAIEEAGAAGLPVSALGSRLGLDADCVHELVGQLESSAAPVRAGHYVPQGSVPSAGAVEIGGALFPAAMLASAADAIAAAVRAHHAAHPLEEGMPREELRARVLAGAPAAVFDRVLGGLVERGTVVARDRVAIRGHSMALSADEARTRDAIARILAEGRLTPPDRTALPARVDASADVVDRMVALLVRQKVLVRLGDLLFHESALRELKAEVQSLKAQGAAATIDVGTFKDRYQVSRKYAIPLLEFLDRERVTRRTGEKRIIL